MCIYPAVFISRKKSTNETGGFQLVTEQTICRQRQHTPI